MGFIKSVVSRFPDKLEYHRNKGEDRIRNYNLSGSLWIKERYDGFRLQTTSDVASVLDSEIERLHGEPIGADKPQQYKYWYIDDYEVVEKIIEFLAKS